MTPRQNPHGGSQSESGTTRNKVDEAIIDLLNDRGPLHVVDITGSLTYHPITIENGCTRLLNSGMIHACGRGVFDVADASSRR